ncbi:sensor histidine kinase [Pigmentibacter ruber]|uniref:sensor histidine kinase n=1 Tax=Pigmentibacter ruber TaxID=2683196 RepID=UPI00131C55BF|nr:HAMP domain-containing sensor histidine kinase [Pigmentibacter ruber]
MKKNNDLEDLDLEDLKHQWLAMIDTIADPLVFIDDHYNILRINKAYLQIAKKYNPEATYNTLINKKCFSAFANKQEPCNDCLLNEAKVNKPDIEWTTDHLFPNETFTVRAHVMEKTPEHKEGRYVIHYRNVTLQKQLQKSLAHADKLAAIGKLAGGIAHELNSPLAGVLAFTQILLSEIDSNNRHKEDLEQIEIGAKKCKEIVENLLSFARQDGKTEHFTDVNLVLELEKTLKLAKGFLQQKHIQTVWEIENSEGVILGNSGQIGQIYLNLITNAIHAMKNGGVITFTKYEDQKNIFITIEDTGSGIKPENIDKIFDPFFTTKPIGEGTGLGLSITYSLVKQHGGEIKVKSVINEGTTFTLKFPKKM